ncbi:MurR/RpiR family transcriptional regulator [Lacticaseibacillus pantheris]|uniref:Bifunctional RpiR family transcriptional regulator sugar isomerase n=1 Tax=Lacticaseibacillus pantheris DSM 15945 = JCM 12539 = NBRC 106106 TaxID=1423783 RepID=A0A0R1U0S8_9LACO|nr:MurR/RpiR family transcriptional regulator [Lacticaseibacillus pantheris]KRL87004.1 bifunctional RpiR family transcriptional regulator sugar isomerase [Lacticaseibacillus pantheris DSM 15945 = JCM 12539 = NBRC 106106]WKF85426.1 MurR/RpiR family transcriptional regulator [Lacticaseibacillus pantheris]
MTVKGTITSMRDDLSGAERKVADYIVHNPENVLAMNGHQLASAAGTSAPTVSRLVKRLGFDTYTQLKVQLGADQGAGAGEFNGDEEIRAHESLKSITTKLLQNAERSLHETIDQVRDDDVNLLVTKLEQADLILCFGVGASYLVAQNIAQKWSRIGSDVIASDDLNQILPLAVNKQKKIVFWFISNSGESPEAVMGARMARQQGVTTVALTKLGDNSLVRNADIVVQTSQPAEATIRFAATQSLHAQFMLIDTIYYAYVSKHYDDAKQRITDSRSLLAEYKRRFMDSTHN